MDNENRATTSSSSSSNSSAFSFISKEINFVKRLQPKLLEFRRVYLSPDFSKKVLEKWTPRSRLWIDLSAIRNVIVAKVEDGDGVVDFDRAPIDARQVDSPKALSLDLGILEDVWSSRELGPGSSREWTRCSVSK
ncbi:digalactosyldiacylglycerol synthase 1 [Quercus suber]|uniref:Digalactosyldiacylglycerol synthase 1 n=1 Tax=Quercus suber TaxID=58331 RepID=A0AAW0L1W6_QUESU